MIRIEIYKKIFTLKTIAVVGLSLKRYIASNYVSSCIQINDFKIIPVNSNYKSIVGNKCY